MRVAVIARGATSCGCQKGVAAGNRLRTHGLSKTPTWISWRSMWLRCTYKSQPGWKNYGGRGIKVCRRWRKFENFLKDMGPRPGLEYQLERRKNDRDYTPGNCYWATATEQSNNRRNNVRMTWQGRTQTAAQWSRELGIGYTTLRYRHRAGKPLAEVFKARN